MPRVSPNNRVRRCLFPDAVQDEARVDNFANILQESTARDIADKSKKWNFDFKNEIPLEGDYEWFKNDGNDWVGMIPKSENLMEINENKFIPIQFENENTPLQVRDNMVPAIRKRKNDVDRTNNQAKRRIDFDQCSFLRRDSGF